MGQFITVTVRAGVSPSVRIFNLNRSITGMAIERYPSIDDGEGGRYRAPDVLARRLFDLGADDGHGVLELGGGHRAPGAVAELEPKVVETIEHLFGYYGDDAGWSPESLRAIGVEPLPTPEPTA